MPRWRSSSNRRGTGGVRTCPQARPPPLRCSRWSCGRDPPGTSTAPPGRKPGRRPGAARRRRSAGFRGRRRRSRVLRMGRGRGGVVSDPKPAEPDDELLEFLGGIDEVNDESQDDDFSEFLAKTDIDKLEAAETAAAREGRQKVSDFRLQPRRAALVALFAVGMHCAAPGRARAETPAAVDAPAPTAVGVAQRRRTEDAEPLRRALELAARRAAAAPAARHAALAGDDARTARAGAGALRALARTLARAARARAQDAGTLPRICRPSSRRGCARTTTA